MEDLIPHFVEIPVTVPALVMQAIHLNQTPMLAVLVKLITTPVF